MLSWTVLYVCCSRGKSATKIKEVWRFSEKCRYAHPYHIKCFSAISPRDELFLGLNHKKAIQYNWTVQLEREPSIRNLWSDAASFVFYSLYFVVVVFFSFHLFSSLSVNVNRALVWSRVSMPIKIPKITRKMCMCFRRRGERGKKTTAEKSKRKMRKITEKRNEMCISR